MPIEEILARTITGIRPFNELPVDAEIWREAHDHHHSHRELHAVSAHRPGIVFGLEVVASAVKERTVIVAPGVGIDPDGQTVVLPEPVSFTIDQRGQTFFCLSFLKTADRKSAVVVGGGQQHFRLVEGRNVTATEDLPRPPFLELARIYRTGADKPIRDAANPYDPGNDELNLLNRRTAFPHCYADAAVGELSYVPKSDPTDWKPNRAGLWHLLREGNGRGFHLDFTGPLNLRAALPAHAPALLYVAGRQGFQPLADAEVDGLRRFLESGGMLFAEAARGSDEFGRGFQELLQKLGARPQPVAPGHPLLTAHHIFSGAPAGGHDGGKLFCDEAAGVIFSTMDYGAAWQGEVPQPESFQARERIRQAQEFGLNVLAFAARRRRVRELSRLG